VVDEAVVLGLLRREPAVPVGVLLDLLDRLAGVEGDALERVRLMYSICSAWILMSEAVPPIPPDGWCIRMLACGSA
jgi:hypothetical protein